MTFHAIREDLPGDKWARLFAQLWPAYRRWFLSEGVEARATYLASLRALKGHMPELVPIYERLCELAGGGDIAARFLSFYQPPPYLSGCSQAVWRGEEPALIRNYDYDPRYFDGVILATRWNGKGVIAVADCLWGAVDGINEAGLAISLTFGGRRVVGEGFGVPILMRYVLEFCDTAEEAMAALTRVPVHMAYNVTALDRAGHYYTVFLSPDRKPLITHAPVATNHQERVEWHSHARATATVEREHFLLHWLSQHQEPLTSFIRTFMRPPIYSTAFDRGWGTLYTSIYRPGPPASVEFRWPGGRWQQSFAAFREGTMVIHYPGAGERLPTGSD
ncbi:MAG: hypothetical protein GC191_10465 [Azospirillum sp.]|nr:hypothetical protein [Azospirillum sp.]